MAENTEKSVAANTPNIASYTTAPAIAHLRCTRLKCSPLSQRLLRHAHSLPFAPRTKTTMMFTNGTNARRATKVLLPSPQIQLRRKAPQFQRSTPGGRAVSSLGPDVMGIEQNLSRSRRCGGILQRQLSTRVVLVRNVRKRLALFIDNKPAGNVKFVVAK